MSKTCLRFVFSFGGKKSSFDVNFVSHLKKMMQFAAFLSTFLVVTFIRSSRGLGRRERVLAPKSPGLLLGCSPPYKQNFLFRAKKQTFC